MYLKLWEKVLKIKENLLKITKDNRIYYMLNKERQLDIKEEVLGVKQAIKLKNYRGLDRIIMLKVFNDENQIKSQNKELVEKFDYLWLERKNYNLE